jgi:predicted acyl esterase
MLMVDNSWALGMITSNATPGAPDFEMDSRAAMDRSNTPPWLQISLHNQLDGPHYRRGSLAPDYSRLTTPSFLGGGYRDLYQNFLPRIMRNSPAVSRGILGPWHHSMTWPGPVLDWDANVWGLIFDTPPLKAPLEILGFAQARLYVSATAPVANWMVQLYDLAPGGTSYLITRGFLNGTHRHSHTHREALVPNEIYAIDVQLMCTGYRFSVRLRARRTHGGDQRVQTGHPQRIGRQAPISSPPAHVAPCLRLQARQ